MKTVAACAFATAFSLFAQSPAGLWASLSFNQPLFVEGRTEGLTLTFAVVNDGASAIDPEIGESHLFINDVEWRGWGLTAMNGPRDAETLHGVRPGEFMMFSYALGNLFAKPGTYTLRWQGKHFRSESVTLRVLPKPR